MRTDDVEAMTSFFRDVIVRKVVKGPLLSTYSSGDTVLANAYAIMSRLAGEWFVRNFTTA